MEFVNAVSAGGGVNFLTNSMSVKAQDQGQEWSLHASPHLYFSYLWQCCTQGRKFKTRSAKPKRIHLFHRVNRLQASRALFHSSVFRHHQAFWRLCIIVSLFLDWQSPWACISLQQYRTTIDCPKIVITNTTALPPWNLALPWPTDQWSFFRLQKYPFKLWLML